MSRKMVVAVSIVIVVCFVGVFILSFLSPYIASADTVNQKITDVQKEKKELQGQINEVQQEKLATLADKKVIDDKITKTQGEINSIQKDIDDCQGRINVKAQELAEAEEKAENQYDAMKTRLRTMYEDNSTSYISLLFGGGNLTDLFSYVEIIKQLVTYDDNMYDNLVETKEQIASVKQELEDEKAVSVAKRNEIQEKKDQLTKEVTEMNHLVKKLESDEASLRKAYDEADAAEKDLQQQIAAQTRVSTASSGGAAVNVPVSYSGGQFAWPTPGYSAITSDFTMRTHPVLGVVKQHTGIDIGAPRNATVIAAADGTVIKAGWNTAYGNVVVISHGGGLATLYGHNTSLLVSVGQQVTKGTPIAKVGSTGYSTGPHCHFEVEINGQPVSPWPYLR